MAARVQFREISLNTADVPGSSLPNQETAAHSVPQLKRFLKVKGVKFRGDARKRDLVALVEKNRNRNAIDPAVDGGRVLSALYDNQRRSDLNVAASENSTDFDVFPLVWKTFPSRPIPTSFNEGCIYRHIVEKGHITTNATHQFSDDEDESEEEETMVPAPQKPLRRGKLYFVSGHVQHLKDGLSKNGHYCLKSQIKASMNNHEYIVMVMLSKSTGHVLDASCHCKASAMGRCSHVAALLYTLDDYTLSFGYDLPSCTSILCQWNQGRKQKASYRIYEQKYCNKREPSRVKRFKACLLDDSSTVGDNLKYVCELNAPGSMWTMSLSYTYNDYELSETHARVLLNQISQLREALKFNVMMPHEIPGTRDQSGSDFWSRVRSIMITASKCSCFLSGLGDPGKKIKELMYSQHQTFRSKYTDYGINNEPKAIQNYEEQKGVTVFRSGLWVNPEYPGLAASPDGLVGGEGLLEIKCPYVLKDARPTDIDLLTPQQRSAYCLKKEGDTLVLKDTHKYWRQIQMQMGVTGKKWCDFVVWSKAESHIQRIAFDPNWWNQASRILMDFHSYYICPEYFEHRIPRQLPPMHLLSSAIPKLCQREED